jgi:CheY-like chemotaxis protein
MTKGKLFLIDWDVACAESRADSLRSSGYRVEVESNNGGRAFRRVRTALPDAIVIDLRTKPSHGREIARALRDQKLLREVPIVCVEHESERAVTAAKIPDAIFATEETLEATVDEAVERRAGRTSSSRHRVAAE